MCSVVIHQKDRVLTLLLAEGDASLIADHSIRLRQS
ncbi:hypothetical protein L682_11935 [Aquipseudomonas alcaligenes OT 69]|nr:hypothetical protein L682_11935 [Pseudomonas alcaligenes OT 69]